MEQKAAKVYKKLLWQDPDRMSGAVCFYGTRVPVEFFFELIAQDGTIEEFLQSYPTVQKFQIEQLLKESGTAFDGMLEAA